VKWFRAAEGPASPSQGVWDWTAADAYNGTATSDGLYESGMLSYYLPSWLYATDPNNLGYVNTPAEFSWYSAYVTQSVTHLEGQVEQWEIGNEANISGMSAANYAEIVETAYNAVKAVDPNAQIGMSVASVDVNWLQQVIQAGAANHFDFVIVHPYEVVNTIPDGQEADYMHIVPTIHAMLAAVDPSEANAPVWVTEVGTSATPGNMPQLVTQAQSVWQIYTMGIAEGFAHIDWFDAQGADPYDDGLLTSSGTPNPAYYAMQAMTSQLGTDPQYLGWVQLNGADYGFLFQGASGIVMATWAPPSDASTVNFGQSAGVLTIDPSTGNIDTTTTSSYALQAEVPILVSGLSPTNSIVQTAEADLNQPLPWNGNHANSTSVSVTMGATNTENGIHQLDGTTSSSAAMFDGTAARFAGNAGSQTFTVDPSFLAYTPTPIEVSVVVGSAPGANAGFNLIYESTDPSRDSTIGWNSIPGDNTWHTINFIISNDEFDSMWGYNFGLNSGGTSSAQYFIQSLTITKLSPNAPGTPEAPGTPTLSSSTSTSATLAWAASPSAGVTGYIVLRNGVQVGTTGSTTFTYTDSPLDPSTSYSYAVEAVASGVYSAPSGALSVTTPAAPGAPGVPGTPTLSSSTSTSATLAWAASSSAGITGYIVFRNGTQIGTTNSTTFTYTDSPLTPSTMYSYTVEAVAGGVDSPPSGAISVTTPAAATTMSGQLTGTPSASTTASWNNDGDTYLNVFDGNTNTFFDAPTDSGDWVQLDLGSASAITYIAYAPRVGWESRMIGGVFEVSNDPTFATGVVTLLTITSPPVDGLTTEAVNPNANYRYVRYAAPPGSNGNIAEMQVFGTSGAAATVPTAPGTPTLSSSTSTSATLAWAASPSAGVTGYIVLRNGAQVGTTGSTTFTYTDSPLNPSTTYSYTVEAVAGGVDSAPSGALSVTTPAAAIMIAAPGTPTLSVTTSTSATLAWTASSSAGITGYIVLRNGAQIGTTGSIMFTYTDSPLNPSTTYSYTIEAVASGVDSIPSGALSVTTPAGSTTTPGQLTGTPSANTTATWNNDGNTYLNVFDGNTNTYFDAPTDADNWVQLDLGSASAITSISYAPRVGWESRMVGGVFEVSNDPTFTTGVVTLLTITSPPVDGLTNQAVTLSTNYRYVRYAAPPGSYGNIAEMHVSGAVALPAWLTQTSVATWNASSHVLTVNGPTTIIADPGTDDPIIEASGTSAVVTINPASGTDIHIGGLSLTNGASATVTSLGSARSITNYRLLVIGIPDASVAPTYTIDSTSTLDLTDNDMAILYGSGASPLATVQSQLGEAYDNQLWDKPGLTSSVAATMGGVTALGFGEASALGISTFDGLALGGNAVLVKYTLAGDTNLDGIVDGADYNTVSRDFAQTDATWIDGDFGYSGAVTGADYNTVLSNFDDTLANVLPGGSA
jgi:hypothetical protein